MWQRVVAVVAVVWACQDAFAPPPGTYRYMPPAVYDSLWADVQACSGLSGDLDRIAWFAVPDVATFPCADGQECAGLWRSPHSIYLVERYTGVGPGGSRRDLIEEWVPVRHEMLHDLLRGGEEHPPVFQECGL